MDQRPEIPKSWRRLLHWFCHPEFLEELEGDLLESFEENISSGGSRFARRAYRSEVLKLLRPSVVKNFNVFGSDAFSAAILMNHSRVVVRNIRKHTAFSLINIAGLAIGMSVSLLIISMITDLLQFDKFHVNRDHIFRVVSDVTIDHRRQDKLATTAIPMAGYLDDMDEVRNVVKMRRFFSADVRANDKMLPLKGHLASSEFLEVFSFPLLQGDPLSALSEPYSIIMTQKAAARFFGDKNPIGESVRMGSFGEFRVTGILADIPKQSHMQFDVLGSFSTLASLESQNIVRPTENMWDDVYNNYLYVELVHPDDRSTIESKLQSIVDVQYKRFDRLQIRLLLQPLLAIVTGQELSNKIGPTMHPMALIILSAIALLILLSSCFNYTNLSIARGLRRSTEVGVRKVVGASRQGIVVQFLLEAVLIALMSLALGIALFYLIRPGFFSNFPKADQFALELTPGLLLRFAGLAVATGVIAGLPPALLLSRVNPALVLKNMFSIKIGRKFTMRKALITFQFAISLIFIIGSMIVLKQYKFALNKNLGFDQENILNVSLYDIDYKLFRNEMSKLPEVTDISFGSLILGAGSSSASWVGLPDDGDSLVAFYASIDDHYIGGHNIPLLAGRNFYPERNTHAREIIVNEAFCNRLQWTYSEALDHTVEIDTNRYAVVGVVRDFNYTHLEEPIGPFFFIQNDQSYAVANLKVASSDIAGTLARMEKTWLAFEPDNTFEAVFLDERLDRSYDFLHQAMTLFGFLAFLAISISCLGMLGMAMYAAEVRAREISIRKVFGAGVWNIFHTISGKFYRLIALAALVAIPLVYLLFDKVILANFAFRVKVGVWELLFGVGIVFLLGMLSIASQTWRAARVHPAEALRGN